MVPRTNARNGSPTHRNVGHASLFEAWRVMLTRILAISRAALDRGATLVRSWGSILIELATGEAITTRASQARVLRASIGALAFGVALAAVAGTAGTGAGTAGVSALVGAAWVFARLVVMRVRATALGIPAGDATIAWACGAVFYVFAATPTLRAVVWLSGGFATYRALRLGGTDPRVASDLTAWGYGAEALGMITVWLVRNVVIAALLVN